MKNKLRKNIEALRQVKADGELRIYALATTLIVVLLVLIFYLLSASQNETRDNLGLGLLSLPVENISPALIFISGSLLSMAIGYYMFSFLVGRILHLDKMHKREVKKTKNELLALASHQLRTPASGVKQYLGMLLEGYTGELKPEQKRMLKKAYNSNERQIETINQLLYVAQADAGELRLLPTDINLSSKVRKVIQDHKKQADDKDIKIKMSPSKGVYVHGDKRFIRMIIENLISNAIKYSYDSSTVNISVSRIGKQAMVKVRDHGVGIAERDFPQLFLKFSRIENELSHFVSGSGIGLFLSQRLAKAHKGRIQVESTKDKGSTFTLILPVASVGAKRIKGYTRKLTNNKRVAVG